VATLQNNKDAQKKEAALKALEFVKDGMLLGLGTGSTATFFVKALAERVKEGLKVTGVPTSEATGKLAKELGIKVADLSTYPRLDLTIDGADEVELDSLNLIKGLGGALLREKIVAKSSKTMIVIVDESKLVTKLASHVPVPVEIVPFGFESTLGRITTLGGAPRLRPGPDGQPYLTDGGHYIADCAFKPIDNGKELSQQLKMLVGVVETGLFIGIAKHVIVAKETGVELMSRK
jgi:ribose 5-phosphate isomerase A